MTSNSVMCIMLWLILKIFLNYLRGKKRYENDVSAEKHGFRNRMQTKSGRAVLKRRRIRGRKVLSA